MKIQCLVAYCTADATGRGLCNPHYQRWYKTGDPLPPTRPSERERFYSRTERNADGCLLWTGQVNKRNGRGQTWFRGEKRYAHVVGFILAHGELPPERQVNHTCDVPLCVEGTHLYAGTPAQNSADMVARGRGRNQHTGKPVCSSGHEFSDENTFFKKDGSRLCRECHRQRARDRRQRERLAT